MFLELALFGNKRYIYILCIKVDFKAIHHLRSRENLRFLLLPLILHLYKGNRFDQTMCECIDIF